MPRYNLVLLCLLALAAVSLAQGGPTPRALMQDNHPVLRYDCSDRVGFGSSRGWYYDVAEVEDAGEPALRVYGHLFVGNDILGGFLYITPTRLRFDPDLADKRSRGFDFQRTETQVSAGNENVRLHAGGRQYYVSPWALEGPHLTSGGSCGDSARMALDWIMLAISDFTSAESKFKRLTASLNPSPPKPIPVPVPVQPTVGDVEAMITPGSAQFYLDDEFKGTTSPEGHLVVRGLALGAHTVRVNLPGYKIFQQQVNVTGGQTVDIKGALQRAGPDPFTEAEIEEGLQKGVTPERMKSLVGDIGVGFVMNDDIEKKLRDAGADDALILACMKNKK
jgi:PEGA domain-containing protein